MKPKVAWIGTGVMGRQQAGHLVRAGYPVAAYSRSYDKVVAQSVEFGFTPCKTIGEAVAGADFIFVMVGYPHDVRQVFQGPEGILATAQPGAVAVDMTTSDPTLAEELCAQGQERGIQVLDAPVSGGDAGARGATLSIMCGGDRAAFEAALPLLRCMGKSIRHMGPAGAGQHTKAANQIAVAGATAAYTEAIVYASRVGLDPSSVLEAIGGGAAGSWQLANMAPRALSGDLMPAFYIKHFIKDMGIVVDEMARRGTRLEMLGAVLALYRELAGRGLEDYGTQALLKYYEADTET